VQGNGFTFDPFDQHELAARLIRMAALSYKERKNLGDASYTIAANFVPERFGESLEKAAQLAVSHSRKASLLSCALVKLR
jgi:hypothetical protein